MILRQLLLPLVCLALLGAAPVPLDSPILAISELFPAEPGVNAERGFAVAVSGDWLAMGTRLDDEAGENAGAVYLFKWSVTAWEQKAKLLPTTPAIKAQFGSALVLRGNVLAIGAPGQGAVYVFEVSDGEWVQRARRDGPANFGRSLSLSDGELAVGAVDGHGRQAGAVYLYRGPSWDLEAVVRPRRPQKGERFGQAVALAGDFLLAGAPGYDLGPRGQSTDAGTVYVFERRAGAWQEMQRLRAADSGSSLSWDPAGDQFGFAIATDGSEIFVGAPTAEPMGTNSGALYRFEHGAKSWIGRGLLEAEDAQSGDQLGFSFALSENLLVAGAFAPPPAEARGGLHVFRRDGDSWRELEVEEQTPGNAEVRDLAGFAVAAGAGRVAVGGVLGDQGSGGAGASWSFRCAEEEACSEEGEAVARDLGAGGDFGASVALTEVSGNDGSPPAFLAVGAPRDQGGFGGAVYLYRRAGREGWRQEARLLSSYPQDGFGSAVAFDGARVAVGAPQGFFLPTSPPTHYDQGYVEVYTRKRGAWTFEVSFVAGNPAPEEMVGASLSFENNVLAIGAPRGSGPGGVYVVEKLSEGWKQTDFLQAPVEEPVPQVAVVGPAGDGFGSAVALRGNLLVIGAPGMDGGAGAVYVSSRGQGGWSAPQRLRLIEPALGQQLGAAVAIGDGFIAVGAPGFGGGSGAVVLFEGSGGAWRQVQTFQGAPGQRLGASLAVWGQRLAAGAPGPDLVELGAEGRASIFERRQDGTWVSLGDLTGVVRTAGDRFGKAVGLSKGFLVVTSPRLLPDRSPRVTLFDLTSPSGAFP
jgi:FG-GAP repeat protein